jgi:hypothetical protein
MTNKLEALDRETLLMSSTATMRECQSYRELLKDGDLIVPDIIEALPTVQSPMALMTLLSDLTGDAPPRAIRGNVEAQMLWWSARYSASA